jgi:hypothetical protein
MTEPPSVGGKTGDHGGSACCPFHCKRIQRPWGALCHTCSSNRREGGPLDREGSPRAPHQGEDNLLRAGPFQSPVASPARDLGEALEDYRGPSHQCR